MIAFLAIRRTRYHSAIKFQTMAMFVLMFNGRTQRERKKDSLAASLSGLISRGLAALRSV